MNEIWKTIDGFDGLYMISNLGRVKSLKFGKEKILSPRKICKRGYLEVILCKNGKIKRTQVHRLVGQAFVPGWFEGAVINHKDHDPSNNIYTNLEWTTQKDNCSREKSCGPTLLVKRNKKLFSKRVLQYSLDGTFIREWPSTREIERRLGFFHTNIGNCCNGRYKSAYGYIWRYSPASLGDHS